MERYVKVFLLTILFCFIVDMIWLGFIAKQIYQTELASIIRKENGQMAPNWPSAVLVYIAIVGGILFFVLPKYPNSYFYTWLAGGAFGLVMYTIYDCTNYAVLQGWTVKIAVIDIMWGTFLCSSSAIFALFCYNKFS